MSTSLIYVQWEKKGSGLKIMQTTSYLDITASKLADFPENGQPSSRELFK